MTGQVLDVLPVGPSGDPCSPALRMGAWQRLKSMSPTRRETELRRLLRGDPPPAGPVGRMHRHGLGAYPIPPYDGDLSS